MSHPFTNHLINETSPYLLQHAHNPVNWYPWGEEALQRAVTENKIILVSIGYAACHWCHVMERESFENEATAKIMNEHFINIKIDREERPDLDHIYMDAVQAITGSGGWPLNVFLTPDTKPFYGGTYFPPEKAYNRSSWKEVLNSVELSWNEKRHEIISQAENLTAYLQQSNNFGQTKKTVVEVPSNELFTKEHCHTIFQHIEKAADKEWGGFGKAPKFPQTFTIQYLLKYHHFTGNKEALQQAILSLDKMLQGGIYDHVGGLARYSTDREWLAPHFEKMLYDNALLVLVLCDAYQITRNKRYEQAIRKTIAFVQEELTNEAGGFYSALDADSEGEEGKYYVWQKEEVENILGDESKIFCEFFDIRTAGNWEGKNIPHMPEPLDVFAKQKNLDKDDLERMINASLQKMLQERNKRIKPLLDDKIILSWNALMLLAVSKAAAILQDDSYKQMAEKNFEFILSSFKTNGQSFELYHTFKNGVAKYPAFLDDYSYFIAAAINLYEITLHTKYLEVAKSICNIVEENFSDPDSPFFFFTNKKQMDIIVRKKEIYDGATPSGNAIMASNLSRLSVIFNEPDWGKRSAEMLESILQMVIKYPTSFGVWAGFLLEEITGINEISVIGTDFDIITREIVQYYIPNKIIMSSAVENKNFPMLEGKSLEALSLIYLCKNYSCLAPFGSVKELIEKIREFDII